MHEGVENILKEWAKQKRAACSADFDYMQAERRVWNILESELNVADDGKRPRSRGIRAPTMRFWKMLTPVVAGAIALVMVLVSSSFAPTSPSQRPSVQGPLALESRVETSERSGLEPEKSSPAPDSLQALASEGQKSKTQKRVRRELYARRDQVVFVAWARSIYTPDQLTTSVKALPKAPHIFSF